MDHLYQIQGIGQQDEPMLEAWSVLAALARETTKVRLSTLVTGVTYRNPALLAKTVTTLDAISGGRAIFGLGAAWFEAEHESFGFEFPPIGERMDRLDEALTITKAMFTRGASDVHRDVLPRIDQAYNVPRPVQPGGPKIMVGGGGEQRTLRIAAKHADMTHWFSLGLDGLNHKTEVLERYCEEIGRDPSTIERTVGAPVMVVDSEEAGKALLERIPAERRPYVNVGTVEQAAEAIRPYIEAGFTGFTFNNNLYRTPEQISRLGDLLKLVASEAPVGAR